MKRSWLKRGNKGLNSIGKTDHQKAERNLDDAVSLMVRARDADLPCILCGKFKPRYDNGHFVERGRHATRFHPMNSNKECTGCNSSHVSGFRPDKSFGYGIAIDRKWGDGTAVFLYELSRPIHQWTTNEMDLLKDVARRGWRVYNAVYFDLRPSHRPMRKAA